MTSFGNQRNNEQSLRASVQGQYAHTSTEACEELESSLLQTEPYLLPPVPEAITAVTQNAVRPVLQAIANTQYASEQNRMVNEARHQINQLVPQASYETPTQDIAA